MSTRAHIRIVEGEKSIGLYHHFDGYPSGVGNELKKFLGEQICLEKWSYIDLARKLNKFSDDYELNQNQHGDENYCYLIDCEKRTLKCYRVKFDEFYPWKDEIELTGED